MKAAILSSLLQKVRLLFHHIKVGVSPIEPNKSEHAGRCKNLSEHARGLQESLKPVRFLLK